METSWRFARWSVGLLLLFGCQQNHASEMAQIRLVDAVPDASVITVALTSGGGETVVSKQLAYAQHTAYEEVPPGIYEIRIATGNQELLSRRYGLGMGSSYTVVLSGLSSISRRTNELTRSAKIGWIFGGAESVTPNGMLPQIRILRDELSGSKGKAMVRAVHAAPGVSRIKLTGEMEGKEIQIADLGYPEKGDPKPVKPGRYALAIGVGGSVRPEVHQEVDMRSCRVYTFILLGASAEQKPLRLLTLRNPMRGCRDSSPTGTRSAR